MIQFDESKLGKLKTTNQLLNEKYGEHGTSTRDEFNEKTMAWYYGEALRDRCKALKLTQKELAQKIGKEQSYIARVEKGEADIQLSIFFRIARALGIEFTPTFTNL
ncbi:MAG: helix-turn-helix domain-containing protein [Phocaeicola sp.]